MPDPTIRQEVLTPAEVAMMLGMSRSAFYEWAKGQPLFPKPVTVWKTKGGREIKRYLRKRVEAFLDLLGD